MSTSQLPERKSIDMGISEPIPIPNHMESLPENHALQLDHQLDISTDTEGEQEQEQEEELDKQGLKIETPDTSMISQSPSPKQMPQTPQALEGDGDLSIVTESDTTSVHSFTSPKQISTFKYNQHQPQHQHQPPIVKSSSHIFNHRFPSTPAFQHRNSTSNILTERIQSSGSTLALAKSFSRRSSAQTLTRQQREKLFDEDTDEIIDDDALIYNVPIASQSSLRIFQSSNEKSSDMLKRTWDESRDSNLIIPPTPLPGKLNKDESPSLESSSLKTIASFNLLSPEAKQLSTFYEYTSRTDAQKELEKRSTTNGILANNESLDDLKLASKEKVDSLTITRPSWCPPKSHFESHKHERQYQKLIESQSRKLLRENKLREQRNAERLVGDERLGYLTSKQSLSSKNINEVRRYIGGSKITCNTKMSLLKQCVKHKLGDKCIEQSNQLPNEKDVEWGSLIESFEESIVASGYSSKQAIIIINWLNLIFNNEFKDKLNKLLQSSRVQRELHNFNDDLTILNFKTCILMISKLSGTGGIDVMRSLELIITYWSSDLSRGIKILLSICVCVTKEYHFGWSNLQMLILNDDTLIYLGDCERETDKFWEKVDGYYNKIK